jgi:hypothetical protein
VRHKTQSQRLTRKLKALRQEAWLLIPTEVARDSGMISPAIPIWCRSLFRDDFARHSGMKSPG